MSTELTKLTITETRVREIAGWLDAVWIQAEDYGNSLDPRATSEDTLVKALDRISSAAKDAPSH